MAVHGLSWPLPQARPAWSSVLHPGGGPGTSTLPPYTSLLAPTFLALGLALESFGSLRIPDCERRCRAGEKTTQPEARFAARTGRVPASGHSLAQASWTPLGKPLLGPGCSRSEGEGVEKAEKRPWQSHPRTWRTAGAPGPVLVRQSPTARTGSLAPKTTQRLGRRCPSPPKPPTSCPGIPQLL